MHINRYSRLKQSLMAAASCGVIMATSVDAVAQAETAQQITMAAQPLDQALVEVGQLFKVVVVAPDNLTRGKKAPAITGAMTAEEAIRTVLKGLSLKVTRSDKGAFIISREKQRSKRSGRAASDTGFVDAVVETIPVYGSRSSTTLDDVTASVGIIAAADIEEGQIRYLQESFRRLANVMDGAFLNSGFVIRGMSTEGFVPAGAPMGSVYVDGVLQTRYSARFGARSLLDVEQVEVYRGPQSTLSGRAATAGAVYIKTKDPVYEAEASISGTVGNNELVGVAFTVSAPLSGDQVAVRLSGSFENAETTVTYPSYEPYANHDEFRKEISRNLRAKILFEPASMPDTRFLLNYSYSHDRPNERIIGIGADFDFDDERGDWYAFPTYAEFRQIKVHNGGLQITHDFTEQLKLTSQSGFHYGNTTRKSVDLGTEGLENGLGGDVGDTLLSQEVRLNYVGERWKWVGGVFATYQHYDSVFGAVLAPFVQLASTFDRKTTNLAAFGEATYEFLSGWRVTLGGRLDYLREKTEEVNWDTYPYGGTTIESRNSADFDEVNFVPKFALSRELTDAQTIGISYSQGFRTGGFYVNNITRESQYYDPETAKNYELFFKGRFLENRLQLNANLFYTRYDDQQIEIRPDPTNQSYRETTNAASSRAWGFELEPSLQLSERISVFASIGYLNTRFKEFNHASYGDLSGEPFPEAPKWTIGFGGRYEMENGLYIGGNAKYVADYIADFGISPVDPIDSRFIVNTQAGYRSDKWEINIFAENLFDERYFTFVDYDSIPVYAQIGPSRSYGINVKMNF